MSGKTLYEKIWNNHLVHSSDESQSIIYIDLHLIHEVTSPQAFEGLRLAGRSVRRPDLSFATIDHNVPTKDRYNITDPISKQQIDTLARNCAEFGVKLFDLNSSNQGIVHVIGPELGLTLPGKTIVCGDSHTATHGAFGALAFGIGTSEVEHMLATQCLPQRKSKTMNVMVKGTLGYGVTAKDVILGIISKYGTDFATGYVIEFTGEAIRKMTMEERMTVCNMAIEAGARAGLIAPDETTFNYLKGKEYAPKGADFEGAVKEWHNLNSDEDAVFDSTVEFDLDTLEPQVTWGTSPGMGAGINGSVPAPEDFETLDERKACEKALEYMGLTPRTPMNAIEIERSGFGQFLFYEFRFDEDGNPTPDFTLNAERFKGASILLSRANFGCGSSREHAPWALLDYGFKVIIAPSFADIFYNNCFNNGILPIKLPNHAVDKLFSTTTSIKGYTLEVDLEAKKVTDQRGLEFSFKLDDFLRNKLLKGLDDIGLTLLHEDKIAAFEKEHKIF